MRLWMSIGIVLALVIAAPGAAGGQAALALTGGVVVDGSGAPPHRVTLLLRGERIAAVLEPGAVLPAGSRVIDVSGRTLIPGLIDTCVRLGADSEDAPARQAAALDSLLATGVTTARLMGVPLGAGLALRQAVAAEAIPGPRLLVAGPLLDPADGDDVAALLAEVRRQATAGVDAVTLGPRTPSAALRAAVAEARRHGVPVLGSLRRTPWTFAARDRVDGLLGPASWSVFYAEPRDRERIRAALRTGGEAEARLEWLALVDVDSEEMQRLRRWLRRRGVAVTPLLALQLQLATQGGASTAEHAEVVRHAWPQLAAHVARLHASRIALVAGSGAGAAELAAGGGLVSELELLSRAGLTPLEAIHTATGGAADALGLGKQLGRLAAGYRADIVVLGRSPLADVANLRTVERVFVAGREWREGSRRADTHSPRADPEPETARDSAPEPR